jgi:dTDP-4-dehydrorhamnose reductase
MFEAADDAIVRPTYVPHLSNAVLDLLIDGETGKWHLSNGEAVSWQILLGKSQALPG